MSDSNKDIKKDNHWKEILKCLEQQQKDISDLKGDIRRTKEMVDNHDDILKKIDDKVTEGVTKGVDNALKGLDDRMGQAVTKALRDIEYEELKANKEKKKKYMEHGIKQAIGIIVAGVLATGFILFQMANNSKLDEEIKKNQAVIQQQKEALETYVKEIEILKGK